MADNVFGGMLGKAESSLKSRNDQLKAQEDAALGITIPDRTKQNEDAANGKTRLTTQDKKY